METIPSHDIGVLHIIVFGPLNARVMLRHQTSSRLSFIQTPVRRRRLVETMKEVKRDAVNSRPGKAAHRKKKEYAVDAAPDSLRLRIFIAEDNIVNQNLVKIILSKAGHSVVLASNGQEAIEKIIGTDDPFDLVFMDVQMPVMDGLEATRVLGSKGYGDIPIIALTASAMEEDRINCIKVVMDDYLAKPARTEIVKKVIEKWVPRTKHQLI